MNAYHMAECLQELKIHRMTRYSLLNFPGPQTSAYVMNPEGKRVGMLGKIRERNPGWTMHYRNPITEQPEQTEPAMTPAAALRGWIQKTAPPPAT